MAEKNILVADNIICNENMVIKGNSLFNNNVSVVSNILIGGDLNTQNINCFGELSLHNNLESNSNIYLKNEEENKYLLLLNNGTIKCNNIDFQNDISIGKSIFLNKNEYDNNSIVLNSSKDIIVAENSGLYISPIRNNITNTVLYYNNFT